MATFQYIARTAAGDEVDGVVQADNETAVVRSLDERRLYPVSVTEQRAPRREGKVRRRDLGVSYGQLADLLRAGVPLLRALETIAKAGVKPAVQRVLLGLRDDVSAGDALADAMGKQGEIFPALHMAMVRAGEKGGFLEDVLANLAGFLERLDELQSRIRGTMIYPAILTTIGTLVISGLLIGVVPQFKMLLGGRVLPLPTRVMFALSDTLVLHWPMLLGGIVLGAIGLMLVVRSERGRVAWERWRLRLPLVGRVMRTISITRFCRILGTMLANGVPILTALQIAKDATGSVILAESIEQATESVRAGETLAAPLRASGLFPADILEMVAVAEESNQLEKVLVEIANTVERRTDRQVDQAVRVLEPLILVVLAAAIGTVAVGLLYPILTMAQSLQ